MDQITIIGMLAATCTTVAFLSQAYKVYKTRHTRDLSLPMYLIFSIGVLLWFIYGFTLKSLPMMLANSITFLASMYILVMILRKAK